MTAKVKNSPIREIFLNISPTTQTQINIDSFPTGESQFPADLGIFLLHLPRVQQEFKVIGSDGHRQILETVISIRSTVMPSRLTRERPRLHLSIPAGQSGPSS